MSVAIPISTMAKHFMYDSFDEIVMIPVSAFVRGLLIDVVEFLVGVAFVVIASLVVIVLVEVGIMRPFGVVVAETFPVERETFPVEREVVVLFAQIRRSIGGTFWILTEKLKIYCIRFLVLFSTHLLLLVPVLFEIGRAHV